MLSFDFLSRRISMIQHYCKLSIWQSGQSFSTPVSTDLRTVLPHPAVVTNRLMLPLTKVGSHIRRPREPLPSDVESSSDLSLKNVVGCQEHPEKSRTLRLEVPVLANAMHRASVRRAFDNLFPPLRTERHRALCFMTPHMTQFRRWSNATLGAL